MNLPLRKAVNDILYPQGVPLEFGCEVMLFGIEYYVIQCEKAFVGLYPYRRDKHGLDGTHFLRRNDQDWKYLEILGKPITYGDILRALQKSTDGVGYYLRDDGTLFVWEKFTGGGSGHHGVESTYITFDLSLSPEAPENSEAAAHIIKLLTT